MTLTVTSDDLSTFLGNPVDTARADLLIELATDLVESIVTPAPDGAKAIVLTAASRAYTNVEGLTQEGIGPYIASRPAGGVYLTKAERSSLRLLAGRGGAFSIDPIGEGYPDDRFPTS